MYKMNLFLKIILILLALILLIITNNCVIFWVLLVFLTFINYRKSKLLLLFDLVLVILLAIGSRISDILLVYKILFFINMIITFIYFLTKDDKKLFSSSFNEKSSEDKKQDFYEKIFNDVCEENKNKVIEKYGDVSFDDKIEYDLDRKYLQSKIRFSGMTKDNKIDLKWNKIDTMILVLSVLLFFILVIVR